MCNQLHYGWAHDDDSDKGIGTFGHIPYIKGDTNLKYSHIREIVCMCVHVYTTVLCFGYIYKANCMNHSISYFTYCLRIILKHIKQNVFTTAVY